MCRSVEVLRGLFRTARGRLSRYGLAFGAIVVRTAPASRPEALEDGSEARLFGVVEPPFVGSDRTRMLLARTHRVGDHSKPRAFSWAATSVPTRRGARV